MISRYIHLIKYKFYSFFPIYVPVILKYYKHKEEQESDE